MLFVTYMVWAALNSYTPFASHITIGDKLCTVTLFVPYTVWAKIHKLRSFINVVLTLQLPLCR